MTQIELIGKIKAEIERLKAFVERQQKESKSLGALALVGKIAAYIEILSFIESLNEEFAIIKDESQVIPEQPEVDLEKEIDKESQKLHTAPCYDELKKFAKYFYELGLNARKEE